MGIFNRKPKITSQTAAIIEAELRDLHRQLREQAEINSKLNNQIEYLVRTLRDMDQEIFNMSQKTTWEAMRPSFLKLLDEVTARKVAESKRIAEIMRPQLTETYSQPPEQKRLGR